MLLQLNSYVGEVLDTIDELKIKDNTIFVFTSDTALRSQFSACYMQQECHYRH